VSALFGAGGLTLLGNAQGAIMCIVAATVYGIGKTFLWPTMLAVVSEQFPKGGAITIGAAGGVGMLAAGLLGGPGIGFLQDSNASANLRQASAAVFERYRAPKENEFLWLKTVGLDGAKVGVLEDGGYHVSARFDMTEANMFSRLYQEQGGRATADQSMAILQGRAVGGTTVVNWTTCFRTPERVMQHWAEHHGVEGLTHAALVPHWEEIERRLNVQAMRLDQVNANNLVTWRGLDALGWHKDLLFRNVKNCAHTGYCGMGCVIDAKQSMLVTYVPRAIRRGARLLASAEATGFERVGDEVRAVTGHVTDPATGRRHPLRVRARYVAVAAGALGTPPLLRLAGVTSPRLGENLALHPTSAVVAVFDHEVRGFEGIHYGAYADDSQGGYVLESVFAYPALAASTMLRAGEAAQRVMKDYTRLTAGIVLVHDEGRGRVHVDGEGPARVDYALHPNDQQHFRRGLRELVALYLAAGAREVHVPAAAVPPILRGASPGQVEAALAGLSLAPNRLALFSAHQMGTAAMSADPARGVTDSFGRVHGTRNLWVADGSLCPTSLGVNPQITIAALADRAARRLLAEVGAKAAP
jgi:choline dehydrogenase